MNETANDPIWESIRRETREELGIDLANPPGADALQRLECLEPYLYSDKIETEYVVHLVPHDNPCNNSTKTLLMTWPMSVSKLYHCLIGAYEVGLSLSIQQA